MKCLITTPLIVLLSLTASVSSAEEEPAKKPPSIEEQREEALKEYSDSNFPDPEKVRSYSKTVLSKSLNEQTKEELVDVARQANHVANLIGFLQEEYGSYHRENFRYEFIQEKVATPHDAYIKVMNEFKDYRNQAYFNLGAQAKESGDLATAFFYYRDAYRLSEFDCGPGKAAQTCMRWLAEQELQKLLGLSSIKSYVSWK